jgi:hypothetical protein
MRANLKPTAVNTREQLLFFDECESLPSGLTLKALSWLQTRIIL